MAGPAAVPTPTPRDSLSFAGQLVLWSIRLLSLGDRQAIPTADTVLTAYRLVGCPYAPPTLTTLLAGLTRAARRSFDIRIPCARTLSADEDRLLDLIRCFQRDDPVRPRFIASALIPAAAQPRILKLTARLSRQLLAAGLAVGGDVRLRTGPAPGITPQPRSLARSRAHPIPHTKGLSHATEPQRY